MIQTELVRRKDGALSSCKTWGHAGFARSGSDVVCAGVSSVLRTVVFLLQNKTGVSVQTDAPEPGTLAFRVSDNEKALDAFLIDCADFIQAGIGQIAAEYPAHVVLRVKTE